MIEDIEIHKRVDDVEDGTLVQVKLPGYVADAHGIFRLGKQLQDSETLVNGWHSCESRGHAKPVLFYIENVCSIYHTPAPACQEKRRKSDVKKSDRGQFLHKGASSSFHH